MDENTSYAQFTSCTSLLDFQNTQSDSYHKMALSWSLSSNSQFQYDRIELYRFIGDVSECINENDVTEDLPSTQLIYTARQNIDDTVTIETYFPYSATTTITGSISDINSYVDDFSTLLNTKFNLDIFHSLHGVVDNHTVINDIGFTRRAIYYILKTYITGATDAAPYLLTPSYKDKRFINHSTKTQTRHNYLHYEGDEIWNAYVSDASTAGIYGGLSRTAVDINRIYKDAAHMGPTGRGGSAWVSDRSSGSILQYNLRDGSHQQTFKTNIKGRGCGIGVHTDSGNCIAGPGDTGSGTHPTVFYCDTNKTTPDYVMSLDLESRRCCYGIVPLYNYPDRMFITDLAGHGYSGIFILGSNLTNSRFIHGTQKSTGYAAAACPNGFGVQAGYSSHICDFVHPDDARLIRKHLDVGGVDGISTRIGVDNYSMYPNTIINTVADRDYFCIRHNSEFALQVPFSSTIDSEININWAIPMDGNGTGDTPGYDGENNLWKVATQSKKKIYRTAGDWFANDGIENQYIYPHGGYSRYSISDIQDWPYSLTNTKEIEWFLTRNHGVSTYRADSIGFNLEEIDASTLDNTIPVYWDPNEPTKYETAYTSWWNMVEQKMVRVSLANQHNDHWKTAPYFRVYKNGTQDINARKWGIRMNVNPAWVLDGRGSNIDDFYENYSDGWQQYIVNLIKSWAAAFTNATTSYIGIANRSNIIQGNKTGVLVHPFYKYATNLPTTTKYINPLLTTDTQNKILYYMGNLKMYNFESVMMPSLYMYSDFTGNILAGSIDSSPLNKSVIHPSIVAPSVTLLLSGYQSNPRYQDTPIYCYPWNIVLPSNTAMYNSLTGYDDLNVTYTVSAYMGTYLVSAFNLISDDYAPSTFTIVKNTIYNYTGVYDNTAVFNYTYRSPSMNGIYHLPSGDISMAEYLIADSRKPTGAFKPNTSIQQKQIYDYDMSTNTCSMLNISAEATVTVLERWPEPKFFIDPQEDKNTRQDLFCNSTWGRSCSGL